MSANRLIAHQRITAAIASLFNTVPSLQPALSQFVLEDVNKDDDKNTTTLALKDNTLLTFDRRWIACQEDSQIRYSVYHLALNVLLNMHGRCGDRASQTWAMACAFVCNARIQKEIGGGSFPQDYLSAPDGTLLNRHFNADTTCEDAYEQLLTNADWILYG